MSSEQRPLLGILLMSAAVFCFALLDSTGKSLAGTYPVPVLVWARYAFHLLLMLLFLGPSRRARLIATRRPVLQVVRALMLLGVSALCMAAFKLLPLAEATGIIFITPLAVALLAGPCLGERVGKARWIAILFGFGGMLLIVRPGNALAPFGVALALGAAACYTAYQIQTRMLSPTEDTVTMLFYTALVGTVAASLVLPFQNAVPLPDVWQALQLASLGVFGGIGHFLLIRAFRYAPASTLSPFVYTQLAWATLLGWWFHGDFPDALSLAGMIVIAASSLGMAAWERRQSAKAG